MFDSRLLYLGVDGGQSSTTAFIASADGTILGRGTGGPCNHVGASEGAAKLKHVVSNCLNSACRQAALDPTTIQFHAACFGMSGGPSDKRSLLSEILRAQILIVTDDAVIAHAGALGGQPGIVTIAGTGSISHGRNAKGKTARAGGWGYIFGDEGGAFHLVREALRAALRQEEGWGPSTQLLPALLAETGAATANDLLHAFYTVAWPRSRVAALAPLVARVAGEGDTPARRILNRSALHLAGLAHATRAQLFPSAEPVRFSYIGGVFQSPAVLSRFTSTLTRGGVASVVPPLLDAPAGALLEAYRAASVQPEMGKLLSSISEHG